MNAPEILSALRHMPRPARARLARAHRYAIVELCLSLGRVIDAGETRLAVLVAACGETDKLNLPTVLANQASSIEMRKNRVSFALRVLRNRGDDDGDLDQLDILARRLHIAAPDGINPWQLATLIGLPDEIMLPEPATSLIADAFHEAGLA